MSKAVVIMIMLLVAAVLGVLGWFVGAPEVLELGVKDQAACMGKISGPATDEGSFRTWAHGLCWKTTGSIGDKPPSVSVFPKIPVLLLSMWGGALLILLIVTIMLFCGGGGGRNGGYDGGGYMGQMDQMNS